MIIIINKIIDIYPKMTVGILRRGLKMTPMVGRETRF